MRKTRGNGVDQSLSSRRALSPPPELKAGSIQSLRAEAAASDAEMAMSSADDEELRRACEAAIDGKEKVVMSIRVSKSHGIWGKSGKLGRQMAKPRVLALALALASMSPFFFPFSMCVPLSVGSSWLSMRIRARSARTLLVGLCAC